MAQEGTGNLQPEVPVVRVFISSPSELASERAAIRKIATALNTDNKGFCQLDLVLWESDAISAHLDFQSQIIDTGKCDAVIAMFWERYGSPLDRPFTPVPGGPSYLSGSAYEVQCALNANSASRAERRNQTGIEDPSFLGSPAVFLLRKKAPVLFESKQAAAFDEHHKQLINLEKFLRTLTSRHDGANTRGYKEFTPDNFKTEVRAIFAKLIEAKIGARAEPIWGEDRKVSPFPGLAPFDPVHADVFFGRDQKVARAISDLKEGASAGCPFLLIVGASGAGKSSLMRAGIAPRIIEGDVDPTVLAWRTAIFRPGRDPFRALSEALMAQARDDVHGGFGAALPELREQGAIRQAETLKTRLEEAAVAIRRIAEECAKRKLLFLDALRDDTLPGAIELVRLAVRTALSQAVGPDAEPGATCRLLLMVDQMEDMFATDVSEQEREDFCLALSLFAAMGVWIIGTLRADLYERMTKLVPLLALKTNGRSYDLMPPGLSEMAEIVARSASACGIGFEVDNATGRRLDEVIIDDAAKQKSLPLLQFTLKELYDRTRVSPQAGLFTFAHYESFGGVEGVIDKVAERAVSDLPIEQAKALDRILPSLIRSFTVSVRSGDVATSASSASVAIRPRRRSELPSDNTRKRLIEQLINARIFSVEGLEGEAVVSVAHERVFDSWKRARGVLKEAIEMIPIRDSVIADFNKWHAEGAKRDLLIPAGARLEEAERLLAKLPDEIPETIARYIQQSISRARREKGMRQAGIATICLSLLVCAILVVFLALRTQDLNQKAHELTRSYEDARGAAARLVDSLTAGLRDSVGLQVSVAQGALETVEPTIRALAERNPDDPEIRRIETAMHLEFTRIFRFSAVDNAKAGDQAEKAIQSARARIAHSATDRDAIAQLADGLDLLGDARRFTDKQASIARYLEAYALRQRHFPLPSGDPQPSDDPLAYVYHSYSLIRLGDMDEMGATPADLRRAFERYQESRRLMETARKHWPRHPDVLREIAWPYRKLAQALLKQLSPGVSAIDAKERERIGLEALGHYERAYCIRVQILADNSERVRPAQDLAFAIRNIAEARSVIPSLGSDPSLAAYLAELETRETIESDRSNALLGFEMVQTLNRAASILASGDQLHRDAGRSLIREALQRLQQIHGARQISPARYDAEYRNVTATTRHLFDADRPTEPADISEKNAQLEVRRRFAAMPDRLPRCDQGKL